MSTIQSADPEESFATISSRSKIGPQSKERPATQTAKPEPTFSQLLGQKTKPTRQEPKSPNSGSPIPERSANSSEQLPESSSEEQVDELPRETLVNFPEGFVPPQILHRQTENSDGEPIAEPAIVTASPEAPSQTVHGIPQADDADESGYAGETSLAIEPEPEGNTEEFSDSEDQKIQNNMRLADSSMAITQAGSSPSGEHDSRDSSLDQPAELINVAIEQGGHSAEVSRAHLTPSSTTTTARENIQSATPLNPISHNKVAVQHEAISSAAPSSEPKLTIDQNQQTPSPATSPDESFPYLGSANSPTDSDGFPPNRNPPNLVPDADKIDELRSQKITFDKLPEITHQLQSSSAKHGAIQETDATELQGGGFHAQLANRNDVLHAVQSEQTHAELNSTRQMNSDSIVHQAGTKLVQAIEGGKAIRMRMNPPELGILNVEIKSINGSLTARLEVESPQAHRVLLENLSQLHEMLHRANTQVERIELNMLDTRSETHTTSQNSNGFSSPGHHKSKQDSQFSTTGNFAAGMNKDDLVEQLSPRSKLLPLLKGIDISA